VLEYIGGGSIEKRYQKMALLLEQIINMCRDTAAGMAHLVVFNQFLFNLILY
jgi:hypothetical protein